MKRIRRKDESVRASNSIKWSTLVVVQHGEKKKHKEYCYVYPMSIKFN